MFEGLGFRVLLRLLYKFYKGLGFRGFRLSVVPYKFYEGYHKDSKGFRVSGPKRREAGWQGLGIPQGGLLD